MWHMQAVLNELLFRSLQLPGPGEKAHTLCMRIGNVQQA